MLAERGRRELRQRIEPEPARPDRGADTPVLPFPGAATGALDRLAAAAEGQDRRLAQEIEDRLIDLLEHEALVARDAAAREIGAGAHHHVERRRLLAPGQPQQQGEILGEEPLVAAARLPIERAVDQRRRQIAGRVPEAFGEQIMAARSCRRRRMARETFGPVGIVIDVAAERETGAEAGGGFEQGLRAPRRQQIVAVDDLEPGKLGRFDGGVGRLGRAGVSLADQAHVPAAGAELFQERERAVGRTIVDEHVFAREIAILREDRAQHLRQEALLVVDGDDGGDPGHGLDISRRPGFVMGGLDISRGPGFVPLAAARSSLMVGAMAVYRDYEQADLDAQYNPRAATPSFFHHIRRWSDSSERARAGLAARLDLAYGPEARERLDFFPVPGEISPLLVFRSEE